jgi:hypothetical protein
MMRHIPITDTIEEPKTGESEEGVDNVRAEVWKCEDAGLWHW